MNPRPSYVGRVIARPERPAIIEVAAYFGVAEVAFFQEWRCRADHTGASAFPTRRQVAGAAPNFLLNARENAASDSYPTCSAIQTSGSLVSLNLCAATCRRQSAR